MKIQNLKVNQIHNPIGYDYSFLTLSWQIKAENSNVHFTEAVRISIRKEEDSLACFDSGILSDYHKCQYYVKLKTEPRKRYIFTVWAKEEEGEEAKAEGFFETGKEEEKWLGKWIAPQKDDTACMPLLYKDFVLEQKVCKARLYICGVGLYEVFLDGKKAGDEYLQPGYHSYDSYLEYQTIDMTDYLHSGQQRISILLGEGWYKGRFGFDGNFTNLYGDRKGCIAELHIVYENGDKDCIATDALWKGMTSHILQNGIYDGEWQDDSLICKPIEVEEIGWDTKKLTERTNLPIKKVESYEPVSVERKEDGSLLLDFGESITGWVEWEGTLLREQKIRLQYGELLQKGEFYRENLRTAKAEFLYISDGNQKKVRPHFTYYGFRYVKVEGLQIGQQLKFKAYRIMSDLEQTGTIETSDAKVNKLVENTMRSQKCNFLDIPTDCPQRDERMGWTGDTAIFAPTACFHMNSSAFYRHYMKCLSAEQKLRGGEVPFFAPLPKIAAGEGINPFYYTGGVCAWGDVATILPWTMYCYYGDLQLLKEQYPIMCQWVDYVTELSEKNEIPFLWQNTRQLGDWLALDNGDINNPIGKTDTGMLASAYYYYSVCLCKKAANALSDGRETQLELLSEKIKEAFLGYYNDKEGRLNTPLTQTACAFLLFTGLYTASGKAYLIENLERLIAENNGKLNTGFVGTPVLCPVLSENGKSETAYDLLLNEEYPGWLHEVNMGATTIWERWNSIEEDGTISKMGMNSLNHYAYGSIAEWMYRYMCGFQPSMQDEICMTIQPVPNAHFSIVKGSFESVYGHFESEWKYGEEGISYRIVIPFNAKAKVELPGEEARLLTEGTYYFEQSKSMKE